MKRFSLRFSCALYAVLLTPPSAFAQDEVSGTVLDAAGKPAKGAIVADFWTSAGDEQNPQGLMRPFGGSETDADGRFTTTFEIDARPIALLAINAARTQGGVEVVDPRTLEPLDIDTIVNSVRKTGRVVIVDEDTKRCGVGAEIGMQIIENAFDSLDAPIQRIAAANLPIAGGYMEQHVLPQPNDIVAAIEMVTG